MKMKNKSILQLDKSSFYNNVVHFCIALLVCVMFVLVASKDIVASTLADSRDSIANALVDSNDSIANTLADSNDSVADILDEYSGLISDAADMAIKADAVDTMPKDIMQGDIKPRAVNKSTGYGVYIEDYSDYLSDDEERKLAEEMKPITHYGNVMFFSYGDEQSRASISRTTEIFYLLHVGANKSGVVFSVNPTDIYVYSEGAMYDIVTKSYAYTITDNIYKEAKDDNMYNCSVHCYSIIKDVIEGRKISQPMKYICNTLLALMCALLVCFVYIHKKSTIQFTSNNEIFASANKRFESRGTQMKFLANTKIYSPRSSSSGSGFHSGHHSGGFHGGGFHGGGHHGGGGGHHR